MHSDRQSTSRSCLLEQHGHSPASPSSDRDRVGGGAVSDAMLSLRTREHLAHDASLVSAFFVQSIHVRIPAPNATYLHASFGYPIIHDRRY